MSKPISCLRVSTEDQTISWLLSAILTVGFLVCVLFVIWLNQQTKPAQGDVIVKDGKTWKLTEVSLDKSDSDLDLTDIPPAAAPELQLELEAIPDIVSSLQGSETPKSEFDGVEFSDGNREVGPPGERMGGTPRSPEPIELLPEHKRWSVLYQGLSAHHYFEMLKHFEIEIGVVSLNSNSIVRLKCVDSLWKAIQSDRKSEKSAFYFATSKSTSQFWDHNIARKQNVNLEDTATVHFYPAKTLKWLREAELEQANQDGRNHEAIISTKFAVKATESGFRFSIAEITYRD